MANTYTQLYIQTVFAVQNRESLIHSEWKDELYKYITGIIQNNKHKLIAINGMPNHIHVFIAGFTLTFPINIKHVAFFLQKCSNEYKNIYNLQ